MRDGPRAPINAVEMAVQSAQEPANGHTRIDEITYWRLDGWEPRVNRWLTIYLYDNEAEPLEAAKALLDRQTWERVRVIRVYELRSYLLVSEFGTCDKD